MKIAVVPGTFDPITEGHKDVIVRASSLFDKVIVGVAASSAKRPLFSHEERIALATESLKELESVEVRGFGGLLSKFVLECDACAVVKGLRAITDFEYEFQMSAINYQLDKGIETLFLMSPPQYMYLSSSVVRELASFHGDFEQFVSPCVAKALKERFAGK